MIIKVTQTHIHNGARDSADGSPLGLALKEAFPGKSVQIGFKKLWIGGNVYDMPYDAKEQEYRFDQGEKIEPYEFEFYL